MPDDKTLEDAIADDYDDWVDDRDWPDSWKGWEDDGDDLEVVYTGHSFYSEFVKMLGLDGPEIDVCRAYQPHAGPHGNNPWG